MKIYAWNAGSLFCGRGLLFGGRVYIGDPGHLVYIDVHREQHCFTGHHAADFAAVGEGVGRAHQTAKFTGRVVWVRWWVVGGGGRW